MGTRVVENRVAVDYEDFKGKCENTLNTLIFKYRFYTSGTCNEVNDVCELVSKKNDLYAHRICVYYDYQGAYLVAYTKNKIMITSLLIDDGDKASKASAWAHGIANLAGKIWDKFVKDEERQEMEDFKNESLQF